ncbi:MAG: anti-sigma factor [Pseudomonadota bacterium]
MREEFSDTTLMAYADGEVDTDTRSAIERALIDDSALSARVDMFRRTRQAASDAFKTHLDAPVPDALAGSIAAMVERHEREAVGGASNVVAFQRKTKLPTFRLDLAIAASIALFAGGAIGYLVSGYGGVAPTSSVLTAGLIDPSLPLALRTVPSGDEMDLERGGRFRAIASFRDGADNLCREFEVDQADTSRVVSVACQAEEQWRVQFTVLASGADGGYAPASSLEVLDAYMQAIGADPPLSEEDERAALERVR